MPGRLFATLKGLRGFAVNNAGATPSELRLREMGCFSQGCQSATLGWNWRTPSAYSSPISLFKSGYRVDFLAKTFLEVIGTPTARLPLPPATCPKSRMRG